MNELSCEHVLKLFMDAYPGIVAYIDKDYRYKFLSPSYEDWFGVKLSEIQGKTIEEFIGREKFELRLPHLNQALSGDQVKFNKFFEHASLGPIEVEQIYWPDIDSQGNIQGFLAIAHDITDQKRNERSAKEVAERERKKIYNLLMQAPLGILVTNGPDHVIELQNDSAKRYINGKDFSGKTIQELLRFFNMEEFLKVFDQIFHSGKGCVFPRVPLHFKQNDGGEQVFYLDMVFEPIFNEVEDSSGIFCMGRDVTASIKAKNQAKENEIVFKKYAESMPQIAFITDALGKIIYFNQQWYNFSGSDSENIKHWDPGEFIHPEDFLLSQERWQQSIATGTPFEIEYRLRRKDGMFRWHLGRALPLQDSLGEITGWVGTDTDIHDHKEIEVNQGRLLQLMDSSSDFIGMTDRFGKIIHINTAGKNILGIKYEDLTNVVIKDFIFPEDSTFVENVVIPATLQTGKWVGEFRFRHFKTNNPIWMHFNAFITHDERTGDITGFATVSRDITEMKVKEKKLEEALRARDQFLSMASHELKTPLTSMKLQAQLNLRNLKSQKEIPWERQVALAQQTNQLVGRLTKLIDDMLDVSRIRTGKLKLEKSHQEMGDIVREVVLRMSVLFEALELPIPPVEIEEKIFGYWDRFRIEQVIGNLLTNAIRYGKGNPVDLIVRREEEHVFVSVKDRGYGIPEEDLTRIFDRFERASHSSEVSGLGLGLFISREIVAAHGGQILVESKIDQGSTFHVCLPMKIVTSQL